MKKSLIRQELRTRITMKRVAATMTICAVVVSFSWFLYLQVGTSTNVNGATETNKDETLPNFVAVSKLKVSPNPIRENSKISFQSKNEGESSIEIWSVLGQLIASKKMEIKRGENVIKISDFNLKNDGYFVVRIVIDGEIMLSKQIIKI
ncbi:MAG: T9SS type A sorting domain-containing protein [Bacteroidetes bacterium]|nr:T9SS type A sorting domain-containing protein [Bacteroidota bacterium]